LQRRPRSESLIRIGVSHAAPLNAGVRRLRRNHLAVISLWYNSGERKPV